MPSIDTQRFGKLIIEPEEVIRIPEGILGFAEHTDYVVLEHKPGSPFCWLQSMEDPQLAFVVINPLLVVENYVQNLSATDRKHFTGIAAGRLEVCALVTIRTDPVRQMTVNMMAPLVIDIPRRVGRQVILSTAGYRIRHPLIRPENYQTPIRNPASASGRPGRQAVSGCGRPTLKAAPVLGPAVGTAV